MLARNNSLLSEFNDGNTNIHDTCYINDAALSISMDTQKHMERWTNMVVEK